MPSPVQESKTFVGRFERFARPVRYFYFLDIMKVKKYQYGREGIFQNNEKSSRIDNKTHT